MTIAAAAIGLSVASAAFKGISGYQMGSYQAQVAEMNKKIAEENARRAIERSQVEQQSQDALTLAMLGEQEAVQSASGLSVNSKSFKDTRRAARILGRMDALNVRQAGEIEAYNYRTDAANFGAQSGIHRAEGRNALLSSFLDVGKSLVGGAKTTGNTSIGAGAP